MKTTKFKLTEEHVKLLQHAFVSWHDCEYGAPEIDCKRPYGNKMVEEDICRILGWPTRTVTTVDDDDKWTHKQLEKAATLHREIETALQILLLNANKLPTGTYETATVFGTDPHGWVLKKS